MELTVKSDQLKVNVEALKAMDKIKDEFLANTSHELKTPLHGIIGLSESLIEGVAGRLSKKAKLDLSMIVKSGKRLASLINDILDYSKLKNQDLKLNMTPVDLETMIKLVVSIIQPSIKEKRLFLDLKVQENLPALKADENRFQQILFNLLGNAVKYTKSGGITVSAKSTNGFVEVCIQDTGIGIPEDQLEKIFVSFVKGDNVLKEYYDGSGISLTLTRHIIELHGGKIRVESVLGEGSSFIFSIPCHAEAVSQEENRVTPDLVPTTVTRLNTMLLDSENGNPATLGSASQSKEYLDFSVLIVDDDPINRQVVNNYLRLKNIGTSEASSGIEALDLLKKGEIPDIILLDIIMPEMSGIETCRIIRQTYPAHELPIIFLTAKNQVADMEEAFAMSGNDYLVKPFSNRELLVRLQNQFQLLRFKKQMDSLRSFGNKIGQFDTQDQLFTQALKEISEQIFLTEGVLYRQGKQLSNFTNHSSPACMPASLIPKKLDKLSSTPSSVTVYENLTANHPIVDLFRLQKNANLTFGQLIVMQIEGMNDYIIVLFRSTEELTINRAEIEYIEGLADQIRQMYQNKLRMLVDKELFKAVNLIEPLLDRIMYITAQPPYSVISFNSAKEKDQDIRIPLNRLSEYFASDQLLRVHRSYMVNPLKVERVVKKGRNHYIRFRSTYQADEEISVSRAYVQSIKQEFPGWFF